MAHGIVKPTDKIFSTEGTEWHRLADVVPEITDKVIAPLLFPIVEGTIMIDIDGVSVPMSGHKALVADMRHRADMVASKNSFVPLNIPRASYKVIENREVWSAMKAAIKDIGGRITSAGTLEAGKKFFVSVDIGHRDFNINGDKFMANLNFITSHDGSLAVEAYDSLLRIVCMNTLSWSREQAGEVGFKVYHSQNCSMQMSNLGDLVSGVLTGRLLFQEAMLRLAGLKCSSDNARNITAGFFAIQSGKDEFSTRTSNAVDEISRLFLRGQGNSGNSLYDLGNAATEYWSLGEGVGKGRGDDLSRAYKSNFGKAAEHKVNFIDMLLNDDTRKEAQKRGKAVVLAN